MINIQQLAYKIESGFYVFPLIPDLLISNAYAFIYSFADQAMSQTIVEVCKEYRKFTFGSFWPL